MQRIATIEDVRQGHLCTGCGACAALEPDRYSMVNIPAEGLRPQVRADAPAETGVAYAACPGAALAHEFDPDAPGLDRALAKDWGPVYRVIEAHSTDPQIRLRGSSGGAVTALALYCLERRGIRGVLHTAACKTDPFTNRIVVSRCREDLLRAAGSRYAPASPCAALGAIAETSSSFVFIGKPCDVAATQKAAKLNPDIKRNLGLTIAFFCAGVPSTRASRLLASDSGVESVDTVTSLRYRGMGWPGRWTVRFKKPNGSEQERSHSYADSWGFLQQHRQWRCYICPDHTGEFADIAVGDPWYREIKPGEAGSSLIVARSRRGLEFLQGAIDAGYLEVSACDSSLLEKSQPNLRATRAALWGRLFALRWSGAAVPDFRGFHLFRSWWRYLTWPEKLRSILGTVRRVYRKRLNEPVVTTHNTIAAGAIARNIDPKLQNKEACDV